MKFDDMDDSSARYIRTVQLLIEKCFQFHVNMEECVKALAKHANIMPIITSAELEKENKEFFQS